MNDRFKFRGIHPVLGELQEIKYIDFIHNTVDFGDGDIFKIEEVNIQQSAGLKDKNGKLIYEKDCVKNFDNRIYQVFWVDDAACFMVENIRTKTKQGIYSLISLRNDLEVIGNIY